MKPGLGGTLLLAVGMMLGVAACGSQHPPVVEADNATTTPPIKEQPLPCTWSGSIDPTNWKTGLDSRFTSVPTPKGAECFKDLGCAFRSERLPACPAGAADPARHACKRWDAERVGPKLNGSTIALVGQMHSGATEPRILVYCPNRCCELGCCPEPERRLFIDGVQLVDTRRLTAFSCQGDKSLWCCDYVAEPESEVVAVGTWLALDETAPPVLVNPWLCSRPTAAVK